MRKYDIYDLDGQLMGVFEFDEYQIAAWARSRKFRRFSAKMLFMRYGLNPADLNPDGSGITGRADKAAKKVEGWIRQWFSESHSNAWDVFFKDVSPLAKVNDHFYLEQVMRMIGKIATDLHEQKEKTDG